MLRSTLLLLTAVLLLTPIAASAQTRDTRNFIIPLQHTQAKKVVQEMHWADSVRDISILYLPAGVTHISVQLGTNTLLFQATADGFVEVRKIVKLLDVQEYTFAPTLTFLRVPVGDTRLKWIDGPTQGLEVSSADETLAKAFRELTKAGTETKTIHVGELYISEPISLVIDTPRLRGNGTLTLDFTYGTWNGPPIEISGITPGSVLAVRGKHNPYVVLVQVNY